MVVVNIKETKYFADCFTEWHDILNKDMHVTLLFVRWWTPEMLEAIKRKWRSWPGLWSGEFLPTLMSQKSLLSSLQLASVNVQGLVTIIQMWTIWMRHETLERGCLCCSGDQDQRCRRLQVAGKRHNTGLFTAGRWWWVLWCWYFSWPAFVTIFEGHLEGRWLHCVHSAWGPQIVASTCSGMCIQSYTCLQNSELCESFWSKY